MKKYSIITPVYQCSEDTKNFLESLTKQTNQNFEIIIAEDGLLDISDKVVEAFSSKLNIRYFYKKNTSVSERRNFAMHIAKGEYFIFFDSDCIIPPNYFETIAEILKSDHIDAFGGPDRDHPSFSNLQKAVNYAMTSFLTTGGIRGGKKRLGIFHPRSFNMGVSRKVYKKIGGFPVGIQPGEDIIFSIRILENNFKTKFLEKAFVFHKRKISIKKFFKQIFSFSFVRYPIGIIYPQTFKWIFIIPSIYILGFSLLIFLTVFVNWIFILPIAFHYFLIFLDALYKTKNLTVAVLSMLTSFLQFWAYGTGFIKSVFKRIVLGKKRFLEFCNFTQLLK